MAPEKGDRALSEKSLADGASSLSSGATTPTDARSTSSGSLTGKSSKETPITSTAVTGSSTVRYVVPPPPPNSVITVTDTTNPNSIAEMIVDLSLSSIDQGLTTIMSNVGSNGEGSTETLVPAERTKGIEHITPPNEHVHEHSTWRALAVEDVERGLDRLVMAAKDERRNDDSKTVEEHYSEILAGILKEREITFDPKYLE